MSVLAYFSKRTLELRMPRTDGQPDPLGIRYEGDVLNGAVSVEFAQQQDALAAHKTIPPGAKTCSHPLDLDPVLRSHLHSATPEPDERSPYTGMVRVGDRWMHPAEFRARYPDLSKR